MKVNLGCQVHYFDGWINQDIVSNDPNIRTEWTCDANQLPTGDETVDFMYAGHLAEHLFPDTVDQYAKEWYRVLKKGGRLVVVVPDCGEAFRMYATGALNMKELWQQIFGRIYSYDGASERHHMTFDQMTLMGAFHSAPWHKMQALHFDAPPEELEPFMDGHISRGGLQLGVIFTK